MKTLSRGWIGAVVALGLIACGGGDGDEKKPKKKKESPTIQDVVLSPASLELEEGSSRGIEVEVTGTGSFDESVTWESSAPEVATVEAGLVIAVKVGTAIVTATSIADPTKSGTAEITVVEQTIPKPPHGTLKLVLSNLPEHILAGVSVSGPKGYQKVVDESTTLEALEPGEYTIDAPSVRRGLVRYTPKSNPIAASVGAGESQTVEVEYDKEDIVPFALEVDEEIMLPLVGEKAILVQVERQSGFKGEVQLDLGDVPEEISVAADSIAIPEEETSAFFLLTLDGSYQSLQPFTLLLHAEGGGFKAEAEIVARIAPTVSGPEGKGVGSLRFFIEAAEEFTGDEILTIDFNPKVFFEEPVPGIILEERVEIRGNVRLVGPVNAHNDPIVFTTGKGFLVEEGARVEFENIMVWGGDFGINGGCIENRGSLHLKNSRIQYCQALDHGGGIWNEGHLIVEESEFSKNFAGGMGGGIYSTGRTEVRESVLTDNEATSAGGAIVHVGTDEELLVETTLFESNKSLVGGGAAVLNSPASFTSICRFVDNFGAQSGGGLYFEGNEALLVRDSLFSENETPGEGGGLRLVGEVDDVLEPNVVLDGNGFGENEADKGAGIHVHGLVEVLVGWIDRNIATSEGGGVFVEKGSVSFLWTGIVSNKADSGAGIYVTEDGSVLLEFAKLEANIGGIMGGGILNKGNASFDKVTVAGNAAALGAGIAHQGKSFHVSRSTLLRNEAVDAGGGVYNESDIHFVNSTIARNSSDGDGGGIAIKGSSDEGVTLVHTTVIRNFASHGGGIRISTGELVLRASIVAENTVAIGGVGPDIWDNGGTITSAGFNLIGDTANAGFTPVDGDGINIPAHLGDIQDNGGEVATAIPEMESWAFDAIPPDECVDLKGLPIELDQRNVSRPQGAGCEIGAVEVQ